MTYPLPRCGLSEAGLDDLMRLDLFGISSGRYYWLLDHGFITAECHRLVFAAVIARRKMSAGQAQAMLGDHLYVIGEPGSSTAKVGRSGNLSGRLRQLQMGSPAHLVVRYVEPGLGRFGGEGPSRSRFPPTPR